MNQCITQSTTRQLEPIVRANDLAARQKDDFDEIFKAARNDFDLRAIGPAPQQRATLAFQQCAVGAFESVAIGTASGHVEEPIGSKRQPVQTAVVAMAEASQDHGAFVRATIAIGVFPGDEVWRISDVEFAAAPDQPHRKDELIDKDARGFVATVAVAVL